MLVLLEGLPRAGKSYTAVKSHILPALKKGRKVKARLNGLDVPAIAKHLAMAEGEVSALLTCLSVDEVPRISDLVEVGDLVVIDECHTWWGTSRLPMPKDQMTFFAEHGHKNVDVILMTQAFSGVRKEVRDRVERKNTYQKLTAVGMESSFLETFYNATAPGKFEKIRSKTHKYDPTIFPLYDGYVPDVTDPEVYKEGGTTVWVKVGPTLVAAALLLGLGLFGYVRYFRTDPSSVPQEKKPSSVAMPAANRVGGIAATGVPAARVPAPAKAKAPELPPEAAYVWDLNSKGRVRLSALVETGGRFNGYVEWVADKDRVLDRLSLDELRGMGVGVEKTPYGVKLTAKGRVQVVTAWPVDQPDRISNAQIDAIRRGAVPVPQSIADSPVAPAKSGADVHARVGSIYTPPELTTVSAVGD